MKTFATEVVDAALEELLARPGVGDELVFLQDKYPYDWENVRQALIERVETVLGQIEFPTVGNFG